MLNRSHWFIESNHSYFHPSLKGKEVKDILDYSPCSTFSFLTSLSSPEFLPPLQGVAQIWDLNSNMSPYLNMSASQTPPESSTVALGWIFSFPQQALFLPALGSVPCFTTPWSNPHEIISPEAFSQCQVASWAAAHPRWSDKSPQGRGQSWFLLFLTSCSIYHILVTRPFLAANCDSKSSSLHIARAHGGWGHQQVSNTKWLPLSFFVASFLSCVKVHGDFFILPMPYIARNSLGIELSMG